MIAAVWLALGVARWWVVGAIGVALLGFLGWVGYLNHEVSALEDKLQREKTGRLADRAVASEAAASAALAYRAKEQAWAKSREDIINAAIKSTEQAASAVAAADTAARRLSGRVAALATAGRATACNPRPASPSAPAGDAIGVLAELQRRADERAGILARIADQRGIAGQACERAYDSLTH